MTDATSPFRVLSQHVDTVELSCEISQVPLLMSNPHSDALEATLERFREKAQREPARAAATPWTWGSHAEPVLVRSSGARTGMKFALECSAWTVFVGAIQSFRPRFSLQLRSAYLLAVGPAQAIADAMEWTEANLVGLVAGQPAGETPRWCVSRIDLAADICGVSLELADLKRFTTRARNRKAFGAADAASKSEAFSVGRRLTGFTFGARGAALYARIYDKTLEAAPGSPIRDLWNQGPREPDQVFRVELEIRSSYLSRWRSDGVPLSRSPTATLAHLNEIWSTLLTSWLVLRTSAPPRANTRIERRLPEPWWQQLATTSGFSSTGPCIGNGLGRADRKTVDADALRKQLAGVLAVVAASNGTDDLRTALDEVHRWMSDRFGQAGFEVRVLEAARRHGLPDDFVLTHVAPLDIGPPDEQRLSELPPQRDRTARPFMRIRSVSAPALSSLLEPRDLRDDS